MRTRSMIATTVRTFATLALTGLTWAGPAHAEGDEGGIRWTNGLRTEDLLFNALSANQEANPLMVELPLHSDVYDRQYGETVLREQLEDPSAREFMKYLVSCALDSSQTLTWTDQYGERYEWRGQFGLCPAWNWDKPTLECQQWVSACLLARNNPEGRRVVLSMRGNFQDNPALFTPAPQVMPDAYHRFSQSRVASTEECLQGESGVFRDCGFRPEAVGQCVPKQRVQLGAGGIPPDSSCEGPTLGGSDGAQMVLRVCDGLGACDSRDALAWSEGTCGNPQPAVSFDCPESGSFSVLSAPIDSTQGGRVHLEAWDATLPATEEQAFSFREGAFYGNLFGPGALESNVHVYVDSTGTVQGKGVSVLGAIYTNMYSCHSPTWKYSALYTSGRLCAKEGENCAARALGSCGELCLQDNASGVGDYGQCRNARGLRYSEVITPYLHAPDDIVQDPVASQLD
jgi:hypothetical protein